MIARSFKVRAEYPVDMIRLVDKLTEAQVLKGKVKVSYSNMNTLSPEIVISFTARSDIGNIVSLIKGIDNSHVMAETVTYRKDYTGNRI